MTWADSVREGLVSSPSLHNLPPLGNLPITLHRSAHANGVAADRMESLLTEAMGRVLSSKSKRERAPRSAHAGGLVKA
jgi:hypothetical protein